MELPPGPRAPAAWQTVAWMARPAAFMRRIHERFGDPVTIRMYWTDEPMVLFSHPDAVRDIFKLDPAIAPAGQSWEFLRPFAGEHSILLLDGDAHMRERRAMQVPFHGERMRAFGPVIAGLARRELSTWSGRVTTLDRMRDLTLEIILRVVLGARGDDETARLRHAVDTTLESVRSLPGMLSMALVQRDLGPRSPWGRFRLAVERFARHPAVHARLRDGDPAYLEAVVKESLRVRPSLTIAPRRLLAPVEIAGHKVPAGVHVAACIWLALRREDLWPDAAAFRPERWLEGPRPNPLSWIPFGGGVRRCTGAPFAEMEMREVLRAAADLRIRPVRPEPERSRRSMLVVIPDRGAEIIVE